MERRALLAVILSILVIFSWSSLMNKQQPLEPQGVTQKIPLAEELSPSPPRVKKESLATALPEPDVSTLLHHTQEELDLIFVEPLATIKEAIFKEYQNDTLGLANAFLITDPALIFNKESFNTQTATFIHEDSQKVIQKRFFFSNYSYTIELELVVSNISKEPIVFDPTFIIGTIDFARDDPDARFKDMTIALGGTLLHPNGRKSYRAEDIKFVGLRNRYFCLVAEPAQHIYSAFIRKNSSNSSELGLQAPKQTINPGASFSENFHIYLGPQDLEKIKQVKPEWGGVMYFGKLNYVSHILLKLLRFIFNIVGNWGVAILIVSLLIYFLLYPLSLQQMRSMKAMQALQPLTEELRAKYKDNPQKLNVEIMNLYREHKVNPFGGCLPLILQFPVFIALYLALIRSVALKGANFLWIKDLSAPDRLFILPQALPIIGNEINILPLLMMAGMFFQQKISAVRTSGSTAEQQKIMMIVFPLMFGYIFYHMPSGLVLYWFTNSTLMLLQQLRLKKAG
ncbi:MAG: hypothetical protein DRP74_08400 [Candidatus Omnitrophota bacterium]|nr:MAG: hypothetical protein DRP74_08400 [Candidatus Omnitrophota bacterium]